MQKRNEITILIVDDEPGIREILTENFELDGFKVISASGANEAIDIFPNQKIDFIISDVRMPAGDGVSLLKHLREKHPNFTHIVLASGFAEITVEEVKRLGAIDLITKPANLDDLLELIKVHCRCE